MQTIKANAVFGNFKYEVEGEATAEQVKELANLGLLQLIQRGPSSAAEKEIAGYDKRPAGFKRDSLAFSQASGDVLAKHFGKVKLGEEEIILAVEITEYVPGTTADPKLLAERKKIAEKWEQGEEAVRKLAKTVGFEGDDLNAESTEFARAIRSYLAELAKGL